MLKVSCHHNYDQRLVNKIMVNIYITLLNKVTFQNLYNYHAHDVKIWTCDPFHTITTPPQKGTIKNYDFLGIFKKYDVKRSARIRPRALENFLDQKFD